jgi:hypothetical protein
MESEQVIFFGILVRSPYLNIIRTVDIKFVQTMVV